ncbi:MAG TPA: O-antigen ligase family protein, partial [Ktedonobacterales bacterium]|nr:O-antigen ligase family protein [Ktedonobacterales bacterium]
VALGALAITPWRPIWGLYLVVTCAVVIEQEPLVGTPIITDHLYIFSWPVQLQGLPERPIGFFLLALLLIVVCIRLAARQRPLYGGRLFYPFIFLLGCIALGILHGLTSGGVFRIIVLEVRPFWYLFVSYILAFNIVSQVKHVRNILWITIIGSSFKGVQGVYIVYAYLGGHIEGQNEIMAHEQSFFFIMVLLLLALFLLHHVNRAQLIAALVGLPCLLIALVANNRRADYVALLLGIGVAWVLVIIVKPETRRRLIVALAICMLLGGAYVLAFRNASGTIAAPARDIVSVFNPSVSDARDLSSNEYRIIEDYDLKYTESQSPLLGYGYGKPFLQPQVLPNVIDLDPYYLYVPHNNVLWIWMRLGPLGYAAMWYLFGSAIVLGCLIARRLKNPELQLFAIFAVATLVMEVILAYSDYQFFFYRNMLFIGVLMGVLMKLPAIARQASGETHVNTEDSAVVEPPTPIRPRRRALTSAPVPLLPAASISATPFGLRARPSVRLSARAGADSP